MMRARILILVTIVMSNVLGIGQEQVISIEQKALDFFVGHLVDDTFFEDVTIVINKDLQDFPLNDWRFSDLSACETCDSLNPMSFVSLGKMKIKIAQNWNSFKYELLLIPKLDTALNESKVSVTIYKKILTSEDESVVLITCNKKDNNSKNLNLMYYIFFNNQNKIMLCGRQMSFEPGYNW